MKVFQLLLFTLAGLLAITSCASEPSTPEDEQVRAVPLDQSFSNADIIRNPVSARSPQDTSGVAVIEFEQMRHNFGKVFEGDIVEYAFAFTNTGEVPLLIKDARSTCGCTVPDWPDQPVAPGKRDSIRVRFDTQNKISKQSKPITITANTYPAQTRIYLDGEVLPKGSPDG